MKIEMPKIGALMTDEVADLVARNHIGVYHTVCGLQLVVFTREFLESIDGDISESTIWIWITRHIKSNQCPGPAYQATMLRTILEETT